MFSHICPIQAHIYTTLATSIFIKSYIVKNLEFYAYLNADTL